MNLSGTSGLMWGDVDEVWRGAAVKKIRGENHKWTPKSRKLYPHRDPFDRMLAAQASIEKMSLASVDQLMNLFPLIWCQNHDGF